MKIFTLFSQNAPSSTNFSPNAHQNLQKKNWVQIFVLPVCTSLEASTMHVLSELFSQNLLWRGFYTAQKMKFSIKDFFSKCDRNRRKLRNWSHLLKKSFMENIVFVQCFWRLEYWNGGLKLPFPYFPKISQTLSYN